MAHKLQQHAKELGASHHALVSWWADNEEQQHGPPLGLMPLNAVQLGSMRAAAGSACKSDGLQVQPCVPAPSLAAHGIHNAT